MSRFIARSIAILLEVPDWKNTLDAEDDFAQTLNDMEGDTIAAWNLVDEGGKWIEIDLDEPPHWEDYGWTQELIDKTSRPIARTHL